MTLTDIFAYTAIGATAVAGLACLWMGNRVAARAARRGNRTRQQQGTTPQSDFRESHIAPGRVQT